MHRCVLVWVATAVAMVVGCSDGDGGERRLLVSLAQFAADPADSTGRLALLDLETDEVRLAAAPNADVDTVVDRAEGVPLALSRTDGLVRVQSSDDPLVTLRTIDVNPEGMQGEAFASNPQTVVGMGGGRAYVVPRSRNQLVIVDPRPDGAPEPLGEVDLAALMAPGDMDGVVDPTDALRDGNRAYVTLARSFFDVATFSMQFEGSVLAVVDTDDDVLVDMDPAAEGVQGIPLEANVSGGGLVRDGRRLYVVATGAFGVWDGGIEVVDLDAGESLGLALREEDLERDVNGLAWVRPTRAYVHLAAEYDEGFAEVAPSAVRVWDPSTGEVGSDDVATGTSGIFVHDGVLYARASGLLMRFDAETGQEMDPVGVSDIPLFSTVPVR
jgi:hypothetical protein